MRARARRDTRELTPKWSSEGGGEVEDISLEGLIGDVVPVEGDELARKNQESVLAKRKEERSEGKG